MGNYFTNNTKSNNLNQDWLHDLKKWEKNIQSQNLQRYNYTNNGPIYLKQLNLWSNGIKMNNFSINNNTNNPPNYILNLKQRIDYLKTELKNLDLY
jgi:hypothetical protein